MMKFFNQKPLEIKEAGVSNYWQGVWDAHRPRVKTRSYSNYTLSGQRFDVKTYGYSSYAFSGHLSPALWVL